MIWSDMRVLAKTSISTNKGLITLENPVTIQDYYIKYYSFDKHKKRTKTKWTIKKAKKVPSYYLVGIRIGKTTHYNAFTIDSYVYHKDKGLVSLTSIYRELNNPNKFARYTGYPVTNIIRKKPHPLLKRSSDKNKDVIKTIELIEQPIQTYEIKEIESILSNNVVFCSENLIFNNNLPLNSVLLIDNNVYESNQNNDSIRGIEGES